VYFNSAVIKEETLDFAGAALDYDKTIHLIQRMPLHLRACQLPGWTGRFGAAVSDLEQASSLMAKRHRTSRSAVIAIIN